MKINKVLAYSCVIFFDFPSTSVLRFLILFLIINNIIVIIVLVVVPFV